jgi:hypothetical protein
MIVPTNPPLMAQHILPVMRVTGSNISASQSHPQVRPNRKNDRGLNSIIKKHGGELTSNLNPTGGANFQFTLPYSTALS